MPKQKRNHFIAQGTIRFWARTNDQVLMWDRSIGSSVEIRNTKSVHFQEFLYARWDVDGKRDMSAEDALKLELDDKVPSLIERVIKSWPNPIPLPNDDRRLLLTYMARSVLRHPTVLGLLRGNVRIWIGLLLMRLSRWLSRKGTADVAFDRYGRDRVLAGELRNLAATAKIDKIVDTLSHLAIGIFVVAEDGRNLALGSQPFFLNPEANKDDLSFGIVVHPRILIGLFKDKQGDFVGRLSLEDTHRINGLTVTQSNQIVFVNESDLDGAWYDEYDGDEAKERVFLETTRRDQQ